MRRTSANAPTSVWLALLAAVLCLFSVHVGRSWDFTVDDAGISYSYARNIAQGHGMVLTPGAERVEAATNFLWVLLLVPAQSLRLSHETLSKLLGLFFASGALVGLAFFPSVAYRRRPAYFDLCAPLITATMAHVALWTAAGLENGLFQCLAVLSLVALAHEENEPERFPWSSLSLAALFATRPDGALYAVAIGGAKALRALTSRATRQDLAWVLTLGLSVGSLEVFRLAYFAFPLPNSFYTKKRTFEFGQDLTNVHSAGWVYVSNFVLAYGLTKPLFGLPFLLLGRRAFIARFALLACVGVGFFLPVYAHGDWMEEWRFLTFVTPFMALCLAESARAVARIAVALTPRSLRPLVALGLTPVAAWIVVSTTTTSWPDRLVSTRNHITLDFSLVRGRGRYFHHAAQALELDDASLLDPDVGGTSYDSGLRIIDLFGLGDISIARTHPDDEAGMRESIFGERRPSFVHLHGAWFGAVHLEQLEELEQLYLRLPGLIGADHDDGSNYVRRDLLAAPWTEMAAPGPLPGLLPGGTATPHPEGFTLSAHGVEPGQRVAVDIAFNNLALHPAGVISADPVARGRRVEVPLRPAGDLLGSSSFIVGERPWARAYLSLQPGRYALVWHSEGSDLPLGEVTVGPGAGSRDTATTRARLVQYGREGHVREARALALGLRLHVIANPDDAHARELLGSFARTLAASARTMGDRAAFGVAVDVAREALRFGLGDARTISDVQSLAERMADASRAQERQGHLQRAFDLSRDAVLIDPRRSWMRRRAEALRGRRRGEYDGGRELAAYRTAASALAGNATVDQAVGLLGSVGRYIEASQLVDRLGRDPDDPWGRLAAARGYLSRFQVSDALRLARTVDCNLARDPEFSRAFRAVGGGYYRPEQGLCEQPWRPSPAPFDPVNGSFETGRWGTWTAEGTAFTRGPVRSVPNSLRFVNGWNGRYLIDTYVNYSDSTRGVLRSQRFVIHSDGISFLIGGGNDTEHLGVRLIVDGQTVLRQSGGNLEALKRVFWDVRQWRDRTAVIEVYDDTVQGWGHILVDDFREERWLPVM